MTETVSSPRENGNDIHTKDHVTMPNGDVKLDEMNEKNKQQYNQKKSKTLNRESSYGEIHEQGPEAFFEADNNANENPAPIPHLQQVPRGDSYDESQEKLDHGYVGKSWRADSRPGYSNKIYTSVMLEDSEHEGRPSVYLFIFVNPLSGDQKGQELTRMAIQSFRLKQAPEVQVQIYNILDDKDRELGFEMLKLVEGMAERDELMPVPENSKIGTTARRRQIHVWSAGGDGTVMSVFEELVSHKVNLDIVYFSCIPFGTGNDFSQVLGWGRTIPNKDILGTYLNHLVDLSLQRLQGEAARLDIWELEISTHDTGYARKAGKKHRDDNSKIVTRKMCNYMSIGVQGYVGSGFENQRTGTREFNVLVYAYESAKWMRRGFPPVTKMIEGMTQGGKKVLRCRNPNKKGVHKAAVEDEPEQEDENVPVMTKHPIDFVIQNIPHIWGREVDLWGNAVSGLEVVDNRTGPTDPSLWSPQRANDGKMEVLVLNSMYSYLKKLANFQDHVSRVGQFASPFQIDFREPDLTYKSKWWRRKKDKTDYKDPSVICIMCDGEFYEVKHPKSIKFRRFAQITTLGNAEGNSRLVRDEKEAKENNTGEEVDRAQQDVNDYVQPSEERVERQPELNGPDPSQTNEEVDNTPAKPVAKEGPL
ncbi:hypothetical protein K450DRAFT_252474 [Umbelopsis ramanniana AG]|uniref:diacylglycerol kinase (ATP) n=1 Tax=Umbelopsis ramanniana AG TaxID=1314678 RepID=A0AAD5HAP2_UMBRA|nr:uncharacterized protein K450DRAFT_252474 [Umbelopsis ramanniana AG]KAI8577290.1 hypothetical protein K450DRAFT_252474 [Umbelopsis ramanniana AG]